MGQHHSFDQHGNQIKNEEKDAAKKQRREQRKMLEEEAAAAAAAAAATAAPSTAPGSTATAAASAAPEGGRPGKKDKDKAKEKDKEKDKSKKKKEKRDAADRLMVREAVKREITLSKTKLNQQAFRGVITAGSDSIILSVNPFAAKLFGYNPEDLVGKRLEMLMPSPYREMHHSYIDRHEKSGVARAIGMTRRVEGLHRTGTILPLMLHLNEVTRENGLPMYIALFEPDASPSGVIIIDETGVIHFVNTQACDIFGYSPLELEGFNIRKCMPEPYASRHDGFLAHYLSTGEKRVLDRVRHVPAMHKTGATFPISLQVTEVQTEHGRRFKGVITRIKDLECMLSFNGAGVITDTTASIRVMFGYTREQLIGMHVQTLLGAGSFGAPSSPAGGDGSGDSNESLGSIELGPRRLDVRHQDGSMCLVCLDIQAYEPMDYASVSSSVEASMQSSKGDASYSFSTRSDDGSNPESSRSRMYSAFFTPWIDEADLEAMPERNVAHAAPAENAIEDHPALRPYKFKKLIGKGSSGEVRLAEDTRDGRTCAIKIVRTDKLAPDSIDLIRLHNEINLLKLCDNEHIVKLYDLIQTDTRVYLVMEYVDGGDLVKFWHFDAPMERGLPEHEARPLFRQIVQAVVYLHRNGIVHRDLKLDNIMLTTAGVIKIVDFGFATRIREGELLTKFCGTPYYAAPEIFRNTPYGREADVWSLGVCLYIMVEGQMPFETPQAIVAGSYYLSPSLSHNLQDLLQSTMVVNRDNRLSITEVALHPWLRDS